MVGGFAVRGLVLAALASGYVAVGAQEAVVIPDQVSCPSCTIEVVADYRLGSEVGSAALPDHPLRVAQDGLGRFWLVFPMMGAMPMVFDRDGQFIGSVGREGQGPGEFINAAGLITLPGDSLLVVDLAQARVSVVGPDLVPTRTSKIRGGIGWGSILRWPDSALVHGTIFTPTSAGYPNHLMDFSGPEAEVRSSFGSGDGQLLPGAPFVRLRRMTQVRGDHIWTAEVASYELYRWSTQLEAEAHLVRRPSWFDGGSTGHMGSPDIAPEPSLDAIVEGDDGLLWVFIRVATEDWREHWPDEMPAGREWDDSDTPAADRVWHTVIEVIDPEAARVVTRIKLDRLVFGAMPGPIAALVESGPEGRPFMRLRELRLVR